MKKMTEDKIAEDVMTEENISEEEICKEENCKEENCKEENDDCKAETEEKNDSEETEGEKEAEAETEAENEKNEDSERYIRLMAEFQNFRKRTEKERKDIYNYANEDIMKELIKVLDNFERAVQTETEDEKYKEGMDLIFKQLSDVLKGAGLAEIEAEKAEFDPNFHNAVMMDNNDDFESGQVTEVLQKGYSLNGRVIRPSMVKVNN